MPVSTTVRRVLLSCSLVFAATSHADWEKHTAASVIDYLSTLGFVTKIDDDPNRIGFEPLGDVEGEGERFFPGCAAPTLPGAGQLPADFSFFADLGNGQTAPTGLLIYFGGGGACWDADTCLGSLTGELPTYFPVFSETEQDLQALSDNQVEIPGVGTVPLNGAGGILTNTSSGLPNPYADFAKVYIPYCTGDVHVGSQDTTYEYAHPIYGNLQTSIRHRGFDNLRLVLKWLEKHPESPLPGIQDITVSGSSAGGYGALINFPVVRSALGEHADYSIIIDSANGVLTNGFLDRAFGVAEDATPPAGIQTGVWGARAHIDPILQPVLDLDADVLWTHAFDAIGDAYPDTRISQSTSAYDGVQALVLLFMKKVDAGTYVPTEVQSDAEISATALLEWSPKARLSMWSTAFRVRDFRFYLGAGAGHVHLIDPPADAVSFPTTNFFAENSARNVAYTDWLDDMLNNPRRWWRTDWRNLSCFPNCLPEL